MAEEQVVVLPPIYAGREYGGLIYYPIDNSDSISIKIASASNPEQILSSTIYTYEGYARYRLAHPEIGLPKIDPPESGQGNGNTIGKVTWQPEASDKPVGKSNPPIEVDAAQESDWSTQVDTFLNKNTYVEAASYVPVLGTAIEGGRAANALLQGDWAGVLEHLVNLLPIRKWAGALFKGGKTLFRLTKEKKKVEKIAKQQRPGKKIGKPKKKPDCGKLATYGKQVGDFAGNGMERDHIPNKAALKEFAKGKVDKCKTKLRPEEMETLYRKIERHAPTIAVPKELHEASATHGNPNNALDKNDLQASVKRDLKYYRGEFAKDDRHKDCIEIFEKSSKTLENINNKQYEDWVCGLMEDVKQGKNTTNAWKDLF